MNNPCKDCITYGICKGQLAYYLDYSNWQNNQTQTIVAFLQTIDKKCKKPAEYMMYKRERDSIPTTTVVYNVICELFGDKHEPM